MERLLAKASQKRFIAALLCVLMILSSVVAIPAVAEEGSAQGEPTTTPAPVAEEPLSSEWTDTSRYIRYSTDGGENWTYFASGLWSLLTSTSNATIQNSFVETDSTKKAAAAAKNIVQIRNHTAGYFDNTNGNVTPIADMCITICGYEADRGTILKRTQSSTTSVVNSTKAGQYIVIKNITIDGGKGTVENATNLARALTVTGSGSTAILDDVTITNILSTATGGVILVDQSSSVTLNNVTISDTCQFASTTAAVHAQNSAVITLSGNTSCISVRPFGKLLNIDETFSGTVTHNAYSTSYDSAGEVFGSFTGTALNDGAKFMSATDPDIVGTVSGTNLVWAEKVTDPNAWADETSYVRYKTAENADWLYAAVGSSKSAALETAIAAIASVSDTTASCTIQIRNNTESCYDVGASRWYIKDITVPFTIEGYEENKATVLKRTAQLGGALFEIQTGNKGITFKNITIDGGYDGTDKTQYFGGGSKPINIQSGDIVFEDATVQNIYQYGTATGIIGVSGGSLTLNRVKINNCYLTATNDIGTIHLSSSRPVKLAGVCDFTDVAIRSSGVACLSVSSDFEGTVTYKPYGTSGDSENETFATIVDGTTLHENATFINATNPDLVAAVSDSNLVWAEKVTDPNAWTDENAFVRYSLTGGASWEYAADNGTAGNGLTAAITAIGTKSAIIEIRNGADGYYDAGSSAYNLINSRGITLRGYKASEEDTTVVTIKRTATGSGHLFRALADKTPSTITFENLVVDGGSNAEYFGANTAFVFTGEETVVFNNVTIQNVTTTYHAAAIILSGSETSATLNGVTISNCITNSKNEINSKGVIYAQLNATITVAGTCNIEGNVRAYADEPVKIASDFVGTLNLCNGTTHGYGYAYVEGGVLPAGATLINTEYENCQHYVDGNVYRWFIPDNYSKKTVIDLEFTADPELVLQGAAVIKTESGKLQAANGSSYIDLLNKDGIAVNVSGTGALSVVIDANGATYSVYSGTSILYYMDANELVKAKGLTLPELNGENVETANTTSVSIYMIADSDVEKVGFQTNSAMAAGEDFNIRFVLAIDDIYMGNLSFNIAASLNDDDYGEGYNTPNVTTVYSKIIAEGETIEKRSEGKYFVTIVVNNILVSELTDGTVINFKITPIVDNEEQIAIEYKLKYTAKTDSTPATLVAQ